ncbi:NAD(P)H-hydrate epimerase [Ponticoccus sp. (in: a-proteobacteria)]|uniref:NAD(P)H-hydrate epimerase n=1 Tax=Ponticoccus sp. (in: a-proteobacteria) TaxID=1925025 RepID=UPI003AB7BB2D
MTEVLTAAGMRAVEHAAMESGRVTGLELMERAGQGVVEAILEHWPDGRRALVLCGPGNNGGDGFVVARLLAGLGWQVEVLLLGDADRLPPDAKVNCDRWRRMGPVSGLTDARMEGYAGDNPGVDVAVDAIFGIGLTRPFQSLGRTQRALNLWAAASPRDSRFPGVVSIDVPSGMDADTGEYPGCGQENPLDSCILANMTVTFHRPKAGHLAGHGPAACGKLIVKDIGL